MQKKAWCYQRHVNSLPRSPNSRPQHGMCRLAMVRTAATACLPVALLPAPPPAPCSACHAWGARPYNTGDLSTNNSWLAVPTFGESWHNNHHAFPFSARHGLEWWQVDITWGVISTLKVGTALRSPCRPRCACSARRAGRVHALARMWASPVSEPAPWHCWAAS
jgi:hypothetical protein